VVLAKRGQRIGLLGGSFDPAHAGHAHVAETGLKRMGLDRVWWLVSPQNPLKPRSSPLAARLKSARQVARGPRMVVTDIETRLGTAYTLDTLRALRRLFPGVRFVWLMGADNLAGFQRWHGWQWIAREVPICVVARPGSGLRGRLGKLDARFPWARVAERQAALMPEVQPPAWVHLSARWNRLSSTQLRREGRGLGT
jgi:nicotinate-nucleotide adenylyltransferase